VQAVLLLQHATHTHRQAGVAEQTNACAEYTSGNTQCDAARVIDGALPTPPHPQPHTNTGRVKCLTRQLPAGGPYLASCFWNVNTAVQLRLVAGCCSLEAWRSPAAAWTVWRHWTPGRAAGHHCHQCGCVRVCACAWLTGQRRCGWGGGTRMGPWVGQGAKWQRVVKCCEQPGCRP
jgi:hypothetical protein